MILGYIHPLYAGTIPAELGRLGALETLSLGGNKLTGEFLHKVPIAVYDAW